MIIFLTKLITKVMNLLGYGATTLPGRIALFFKRDILAKLSQGVKVIVITGTNGKTTSARIVEEGLKEAGKSYFINRSGANLITGITTSFILNSTNSGKCTKEYAVIECDENAFRTVSKYLKAKVVLVTNVFRDQLDRYGEVSHTLSAIQESVNNLPEATLVINGDCSLTNTLKRENTVTYGVSVPLDQTSAVRDGTRCIHCKHQLEYDYFTYAHLGKYRCPGCGYCRETPDYNVTDIVETTPDSSTVMLNGTTPVKINLGGVYNIYNVTDIVETTPDSSTVMLNGTTPVKINLGGVYNIYNGIGALAALVSLGIDRETALHALERFSGAFGRMEKFGNVRMILVKNPAGLTQTCNYISQFKGDKTVIFCLNDNAADGRDISWIWDADIQADGKIYAAGKRSGDMALRLKYSGMDAEITDDVLQTVLRCKGDVFVVPTYTAMMAMRPKFAEHFGKEAFWK